ncbi:Enoyl-CoA hydratase/isomerase [Thermoproteus uzoniensis 768-20]|uniref:Enoyl-CoA hydratase/isomerase n=1 Tax=Thermoproteus uzoniensis (strain 768-20) TaxID=999630 RepID=F2L5B4_THEU7|nr:enoyl-CoA hydratase/isomerase family protein [Thermoproteus uzoniensis]AEA13539.1 Enoyl-CoA hydratase/isomerase [Thermoproteus uzoniensis 768-20]
MKSINFNKVNFWNEDNIGVIAINNNIQNFLDIDVIVQLSAALMIANNDDKVRWIAITGTGSSFFTAGVPWEFIEPTYASIRELVSNIKTLFSVLSTTPKPIVAVLNGSAVGLGMELALASDLTIAPPDVYLCYPEGAVDVPTLFSFNTLIQKLPRYDALNVLAGSPLPASVAAERGLIYMVGRDNLFGDAKSLIKQIKINQYTKELLYENIRRTIEPASSRLLDALLQNLLDSKKREVFLKTVRNLRNSCISKYKI